MLVVVFNDGTTHKIKGCNEYCMPSAGYYGNINIDHTKQGTIYNKSNIAFCYFAKDEENNNSANYQFAIEQLEQVKKFFNEYDYSSSHTTYEIISRLDRQIKQLTHQLEDKGE